MTTAGPKKSRVRRAGTRVLRYPVLRVARKWDWEDLRWIWIWFLCALGFCVVASGVVWVIHKWELLALSENDIQTLEVFVSVFGLAYAVVVGLLIIEAHGRFHALSTAFRSELNALSDIHDCLRYYDDSKQNKPAKERIRGLLWEYANGLKNYEWPLMIHSRVGTKALMFHWQQLGEIMKKEMLDYYHKKDIELYLKELDLGGLYLRNDPFQARGVGEIIKAVKKLKSTAKDGQSAWEKIVDKICDLTSRRTDRLELAESGLKGYLKFFLIFMSLVIVGGTIFLDLAELWLHLFMVCATTAGVVGLYMVLIDVDTPFTGFWHIDETLLDYIKEKLK